jgi:SSS family solute:Na+ symporter
MFPQLFQRFLAAKDEKALKIAALFYPLVTGVLFFFPVALGVMAHKVLPGIEGAKTDQILPLLVNKSLPGFFSGVLTVCGIAALMSTMDSQLLTLSSMLVRDIRVLLGKPAEGSKPLHFLVVVILALVGFFLALRPWGTILQIATETFTGLAVLFPVTVAAAYWQKANPWAGFAAIVIGEVLVVLYHFKLLPGFGFLAVVPVVVVVSGILIGGSFLLPARGLKPWVTGGRIKWWQVVPFFVIFVLSLDFYNWHRQRPVVLGLPLWLWFHFLLIGLLFLALIFVLRAGKKEKGSAVGSGAETLFDEHYAPGEGD